MSVRDRMVQDLELAGYSESTRSTYVNAVGDLAKFYWRCPSTLEQDELRRWIDYLRERAHIGASRLVGHMCALKFFYAKTLGKPELVSFISLPSRASTLPEILSIEEVQRLLSTLREPKYRVFFTTMYATGLRINEACLLQTGDIDAARGVIHVRHGKGGKERLAPLSKRLLELLRAYWKQVRPAGPWLFPARRGDRPVIPVTVRQALNRAVEEAGLDKYVTPHVLRHSFATHLLEAGTDVRIIQVLLGHAHVDSTSRYARVSSALIAKAPSTLDLLDNRPD